MTEVWKDIPEYFGLYQASSIGRIRSLNTRCWYGNRLVKRAGRVLKLMPHPGGYWNVVLLNQKKVYVHRLIATTFISNLIIGKSEVNHINGIKTDNRVENLEWVTSSQNKIHAFAIGLKVGMRKYGVENSNYRHGNRMKPRPI